MTALRVTRICMGTRRCAGRSEEAQGLVPQAAKLLRHAGDLRYLARLHMNLGNAAYHREDFLVAREEFARAAEIFDQIGEVGPPRVALQMKGGEPIPAAERGVFEQLRSRTLATLASADQ